MTKGTFTSLLIHFNSLLTGCMGSTCPLLTLPCKWWLLILFLNYLMGCSFFFFSDYSLWKYPSCNYRKLPPTPSLIRLTFYLNGEFYHDFSIERKKFKSLAHWEGFQLIIAMMIYQKIYSKLGALKHHTFYHLRISCMCFNQMCLNQTQPPWSSLQLFTYHYHHSPRTTLFTLL